MKRTLLANMLVITMIVMGVAVAAGGGAAFAYPPMTRIDSSPHMQARTASAVMAFEGGGSITVAAGKSRKLALKCAAEQVLWESSSVGTAAVSQTGLVSAKRAGVARVTARNLETGRVAICTVKVYQKRTQKQARKAVLALKKTYRPGLRWTNENYYYWQAANCHCYGCVAFAGIASDKAFGKFAPFKRHARFAAIKSGDHVRIGGSHSVVVLARKGKSITVAEGNYRSTFKWGRKISYAELKRQGFYVETRY